MKVMASADRPREKLDRVGPAALGDNELLAIVIGHGTAATSALELANSVLAASGGIHALTRRTMDDLRSTMGIGSALAGRIVAAVELGRRTLARIPEERLQFATPREMAAYLAPTYGAAPVERFGVVLMDARHRLLRVRLLTSGSLSSTTVHPRDVYREAIAAGAATVVVFHNHPSGDPTPSHDDIVLSRRFAFAGELMGIDLIDHLILADARYWSFQEVGGLRAIRSRRNPWLR